MSSSVKPLTISENVMVTSNAPCAGKSCQLSIVTVGEVDVGGGGDDDGGVDGGGDVFTEKLLLPARLPLVSSAAATATPAGTVTVTLPWKSSLGVTTTLNASLSSAPEKLPAEPFVTPMSASSNPVTFSENTMFTVKLPLAGKRPGLLITTVGPESAPTSVSSSRMVKATSTRLSWSCQAVAQTR